MGDNKKNEEIEINGELYTHCGWCGELYPKSEMKKEVDLGYLCNGCIQAIRSRGEKLTINDD